MSTIHSKDPRELGRAPVRPGGELEALGYGEPSHLFDDFDDSEGKDQS